MIRTFFIIFMLLACFATKLEAQTQLPIAGIIQTSVAKTSNHRFIFKINHSLIAADSTALMNMFLGKEGFLSCNVNTQTGRVEVDAIYRVTAENILLIVNYLGFVLDTAWATNYLKEEK